MDLVDVAWFSLIKCPDGDFAIRPENLFNSSALCHILLVSDACS